MEGPGSFNLADVWEMAADLVPEREALVVGDDRRTYAQLEDRANRLASWLTAAGVGPGDHVGVHLQNGPEYVEAMLAAFKLRAVPVNVNYRYVTDELRYLLDNSGSVVVVTQPSLADRVDAVRPSLPGLREVLVAGDGYDAALAASSPERPAVERSGDDHYVLYTGGTTGLPKGVVWRHEDAFFACIGGGDPMRLLGAVGEPHELVDRLLDQPFCYLPLAPMIHAAAQWTSLSWLFCGGKVVLMPGSLDPAAVWRAVAAEGVQSMTVIGDAVARPLLDEWDRAGGYDASSLFSFSNGGAPMSQATKERVFRTLPHVLLVDGFGSSEAGTQGASRLTADRTASGASLVTFDAPAKPILVVDSVGPAGEVGDPVEPGSGVVGHVLAGGRLPLGYHNDPERTAATFVGHDGERWLVTGDMATVEADGSIGLRGRASGVVNTGGEKVFPEEVEGVLKAHAAVYDCLVVGVADDRWGSAVCAVVQPVPGVVPPGLDDLVAHCRDRLAGYKAPKHLVLVDQVVRSPTGKPDYRWAASAAAGSGSSSGSGSGSGD
jgi:acyl-CoA synthetase (AMP-forming)/AMP-acid ligase II